MNAISLPPWRPLAAAAAAATLAVSAHAGTVSSSYAPVTLNTLVSLEATQEALAGLVLWRPDVDASTLSGQWSGTADDLGWSLDFTGTWATDSVTLHHSGLLDVPGDYASWNYSGQLAGQTFAGEGRIDFDPRWWSIFLQGVLRVVVYGTQAVVDGGTTTRLVSDGVVWVGDKIIEHYMPEESEITPEPPPSNPGSPPPTRANANVKSKLAMVNTGYQFTQTGTLSPDNTLSFTTTVSPIPEPALAWLWWLGVPSVLALRRRRVFGVTPTPDS